MADEGRDNTDDWIVPLEERAPSAFELQRRIAVAIGTARAAEEVAMEIGKASLEAAEQARDAAVHAERSAAASVAAARAVAGVEPAPESPPAREPLAGHELIPGSELPAGWSPVAAPGDSDLRRPPVARKKSLIAPPQDERLRDFDERARRVLVRLISLTEAAREPSAA